ncbi:genetic suppressor element 1 isoform X1 [Silurus meridionalis]|nr:genetic suppressor element 1 isoform X1 [Silurus meridionalis]
MNEAGDQEAAAVPRKHRLMSAVHGGASPGGLTCRPGRVLNGVVLVHCFVCGSGVTPGKELQLQVKHRHGSAPFFPFLHGQEPAPGAAEVGADGHALVCAVCHCFLREQWNAFERSRTPLDKRVYWLKRPHQCDARRAPRDWNATRDADARPSASGQDGDGDESDFSSFSDNEHASDQDSDMGERIGGGIQIGEEKEKCLKFPPRACKDARDAEKLESARMNHVALSRLHGNLARPESPSADTPTQDMQDRRSGWNSRLQQLLFGPGEDFRSHEHAKEAGLNQLCDSDASDGNEINVTSDEDHEDVRKVMDRHVCYICSSRLLPNIRFEVCVQKQERATSEPFFPFLWLHTPPPDALPISPGGRTLVCASCHASLMQQWQSFELADVPVLQRLYVVPVNVDGTTSPNMDGIKIRPISSVHPHRNACYLCGQDCAQDIRVAYSRAGVGKARGAMYFPFINLLPCPPNAQNMRDGQVHCCSTCYTILEDIWAAYRLCLSEELITSVSTFLGRYHHTTTTSGGVSSSLVRTHESIPASLHHTSVCYLCGTELSGGTEHQLHVNPPGRCGEKEPFFPFLTVHTPAPRSRPADATGLVAACSLCYHDLLAQWAQHEAAGSGPSSSPWSRQYSCESFVCFFCRQEKRRALGLRAVNVARLPVFLYAPRVRHTLVVDDGKQLTIGSCVECKSMVLAGQNMHQDVNLDHGRPAGTKQKKSEGCYKSHQGLNVEWDIVRYRTVQYSNVYNFCPYFVLCVKTQQSSTAEEPAGSSKEDARHPATPLREVSKHVGALSRDSGINITSSRLSSDDRDRSPSNGTPRSSARFSFSRQHDALRAIMFGLKAPLYYLPGLPRRHGVGSRSLGTEQGEAWGTGTDLDVERQLWAQWEVAGDSWQASDGHMEGRRAVERAAPCWCHPNEQMLSCSWLLGILGRVCWLNGGPGQGEPKASGPHHAPSFYVVLTGSIKTAGASRNRPGFVYQETVAVSLRAFSVTVVPPSSLIELREARSRPAQSCSEEGEEDEVEEEKEEEEE